MGPEKRKMQRPIKEGLFALSGSPADKPQLIGARCSECGYVSFPKRPICPFCLKQGTMGEVSLSPKGTINTFTISRVAPARFKAPYIQAYVDLPEGPRVFSMIAECDPSEQALEIGTEVELVIGKVCEDEDGTELVGYMFRPL